jgi:hypothetical protein
MPTWQNNACEVDRESQVYSGAKQHGSCGLGPGEPPPWSKADKL